MLFDEFEQSENKSFLVFIGLIDDWFTYRCYIILKDTELFANFRHVFLCFLQEYGDFVLH